MSITETSLDDSSHISDISGYNFIHYHRVDRSGGGVGIYLHILTVCFLRVGHLVSKNPHSLENTYLLNGHFDLFSN